MAPFCFEHCSKCGRTTKHWFDLATEKPGYLRCLCEECGEAVVLLEDYAVPTPVPNQPNTSPCAEGDSFRNDP